TLFLGYVRLACRDKKLSGREEVSGGAPLSWSVSGSSWYTTAWSWSCSWLCASTWSAPPATANRACGASRTSSACSRCRSCAARSSSSLAREVRQGRREVAGGLSAPRTLSTGLDVRQVGRLALVGQDATPRTGGEGDRLPRYAALVIAI